MMVALVTEASPCAMPAYARVQSATIVQRSERFQTRKRDAHPAAAATTARLSPDPVRLVGLIRRAPEWRGLGVYLDLQVETLDGTPASGRARLTEFLDEPELNNLFEDLELGRGDRVEILVRLRRPLVYRNPGAFDFRRYLERQGVYWTGTIRNPRLITILDRGWHRRRSP